MTDFIRVATTAFVFESIISDHPELKCFGGVTKPSCDNLEEWVMEFLYGFEGCKTPHIGVKTILDNDMIALRKEYWLCLPLNRD